MITKSAHDLGQALSPAADVLKLAMANTQRHGGFTGGSCGCSSGMGAGYFGGETSADPAKGLREYEASLSAKAKEDVIRGLARALKRAGINVDPEAPLEDIVREFVDQIPNPKNGKTFSSDAKAQEKVCRVIADVLNDEFTPGITKHKDKFIDTSLSTVEVCRQVGEWGHSFAAGVNTEFLAVHASVKNTLRNVEILAEIMRELYNNMHSKIEKDGDANLNRIIDPLDEIYSRAQAERNRQESFLKNILKVQLAPAAKELEIAMQDASDQNALIKRLGLKPGTSDFGDSLAAAISNLGTAASIAQRVHKALKQVGISVGEYLESSEFTEFERLLDSKIENGMVKADDLAKFIQAMTTLRLAFDNRTDDRFREALEEKEKSGGAPAFRRGGDDDDDVDDEYRSTMDKRVRRVKREKSLIVRDFVGRMARHYDELLATIKAMGPEFGKKIPLTEKTDALRDAIVRLNDMRQDRIELSLIGLYADSNDRQRKESFLSGVRLVSSTCEDLMELEVFRNAGPYLARLKAAADAIEKTIDYFSDVVTKKFGGAVDDDDDDGDKTMGGASDDLLPEIARSGVSLNEAIGEFSYFYYVANVRKNLDQSAGELDTYGEKYIDVLGDAVAARIWNLRQERQTIIGRFTTANRNAGGAMATAFPAGDRDGNAGFEAAKKMVNQEYDTKDKLYKALQALDLYMKAFTVGIAKDPDAVRDIKKMLDGTQVIARWFNEETGDKLYQAFESMGSTDFQGRRDDARIGAAILADTDSDRPHYYQKVGYHTSTARNVNGLPAPPTVGIPQISIPAGTVNDDKATKVKKDVVDALDHFQALKNLVNAFSRIGDRFGGRELRSQVFMSPTQIFKALMDYMKHSAMSINAKGNSAADEPGDKRSETQWQYNDATIIADAVRPYEIYFNSVGGGAVNETIGNYVIEDRYFVIMVKAMAAKILTTLGVYDMFERRTPLYDLTSTRLIVGGGEDDTPPEVIEGATELYFRLPRLVEFYRSFLHWDGNNGTFKISMLPELEGIFSGIIKLIFQKVANPQVGDYSDHELHTLIREINVIYTHFHEKHGDQPVRAAMNAFIMEINRRYGIIKSEDMLKYWALVRRSRRNNSISSSNDTNFAILPGEDDIEVNRRAPSDRYTLLGTPAAVVAGVLPREFTNRPLLDDDVTDLAARRMLLREFRNKLEKEFGKVPPNLFGKVSYSPLIKQATAEIHRATGSETKLNLAKNLIHGMRSVNLDANKAFMFHETVVVGLNVLNGLHAFITNLQRQILKLDIVTIKELIMDTCYAVAIRGAALPANFGHATLTGANYTNFAGMGFGFENYVLEGEANAAGGLPYFSYSGLDPDVTSQHIYEFWRLEGTYIGADVTRQLPVNMKPSQVTDADLETMSAERKRTVRALRYFARLVLSDQSMMRDFIEMLFSISGSSGGLIEVRFPQGASIPISINFSKFREVAGSLMADVKHYLDKLRPFIGKNTIKTLEDPNVEGSIYWLEKELFDKHIRGESEQPVDQLATLDGISRQIGDLFVAFTGDTGVPIAPSAIANLANHTGNAAFREQLLLAPAPGNAESRKIAYGRTLCELIFYDAPASTIPTAGGLAVQYDLGSLITELRVPPALPALPVLVAPPGPGPIGPIERYNIYNSTQGMTRHRSLLFAFNQLLAEYLSKFTDPAGQKIYFNLINAYANGVAARSVSAPAGNSCPDIMQNGYAFGNRGDPSPGAILLQSLAYVLRRLLKDINQTSQVNEHLVTTMVDVPLYMKESYRANLPGFIRYFDLIVQKSDFLKQLMQKTTILCDRPNQLNIMPTLARGDVMSMTVAGAPAPISLTGANAPGFIENSLLNTAIKPLDDVLAGDRLLRGVLSKDMKLRLAELLDAISTHAYTLSSSATEVLKELADQPVYLQTQENSIETYKIRYGKLPLMPLSITLHFLNDLEKVPANPAAAAATMPNDTTLYPSHSLGEPQFKMQYGVRGLLIRQLPVEFSTMPGVKAALDEYNSTSTKREQLDPARYLVFVKSVVAAVRFFIETRNYKSMLSTNVDDNYLAGNSIISAIHVHPNPNANASYAIATKQIRELLMIVESSNQEDELNKITSSVGPPVNANNDRQLERILNLVDMNVIPINVHALMRDTPLANLYNYEYTFEQMVASFYGEQINKYTDTGSTSVITDATTKTTTEMFLRLLIDPYMPTLPAAALIGESFKTKNRLYGSDVHSTYNEGFVFRIFRGDNGLGLGRPKFLSDQIFNKILFGSTYQERQDYDEAGPGVGSGFNRGRDTDRRADIVGLLTRALELYTRLKEKLDVFIVNVVVAAGVAGGMPPANIITAVIAGGSTDVNPSNQALLAWLGPGGGVAGGIDTLDRIVTPVLKEIAKLYEQAASGPAATGVAAHQNLIDYLRRTIRRRNPNVNTAATIDANYTLGDMIVEFEQLVTTRVRDALQVFYKHDTQSPNAQPLVTTFLGDPAPNASSNIEVILKGGQLVQAGGASPWPSAAEIVRLIKASDTAASANDVRTGPTHGSLSFLSAANPDKTAPPQDIITEVSVGDSVVKAQLEMVGRLRFDTRLVRNLFFISNVQRFIRAKLARELTQSRSVIVSSHSVVAPSVTEYGADPFGANEVYGSVLRNGMDRYNDKDQNDY
jgi:hypothetical protein